MTTRFRSPRSRARPRRPLTDFQAAALRFLGAPAAGAPVHGETTRCVAYLCPWAYTCPIATPRPAQVEQRSCMRFWNPGHRPRPGLSDFALDLLAFRRQEGKRVSEATQRLLDIHRPHGPSRKASGAV